MHKRSIDLTTFIVMALLVATGCSSTSDQTTTGAATDPDDPSTTAIASPSETTEQASTSTSTSTEPDAGVDTDPDQTTGPGAAGQDALFPSVATFGIAFDSLNIELSEQFDFARIDITGSRTKLPDPDGPGAFVTRPDPDVLVGGWVDEDGAVTSAAMVSPFGTAVSLSAVLTLMSVTVEDTDANIDAVNQALVDLDASGLGGREYLVLDGRGVLLEVVEIDGEPNLSAVVTGEATAADAIDGAAALRTAMTNRLAN